MGRVIRYAVAVAAWWPVLGFCAEPGASQVESRGERLDPALYGPGIVEDMEAVLARERAQAETEPVAETRHGQWVVPSRRSTCFPHSGVHNVVNKSGDTRMGIGFGREVHLHGAYLSGQGGEAVWTPAVRVVGYRDGREVTRTGWFTDIDETPTWFEMDLRRVDRVVIESQATDAGGGWYALDDIAYTPDNRDPADAAARVVVDFEDTRYHQKLTGTGYAGLTWEEGAGETLVRDALPAPQVPPGAPADDAETDDASVLAMPQGEGTLPQLGLSFKGVVRGDQSSWSFPPDTCGAVGPNHFVIAVNRVFAVYSKTTGSKIMGMQLGNFLPGSSGDPRVLYDQHSGRWIVIVSDFSSRIYLAVSTTSNPTGSWYKTNFVASTGFDAGAFPDYPTLGVDANGIYTSAYMVGNGMSVFAIDKAPLVASPPSLGTVTAFRGYPYEGAIQPVHTYGSPQYQYFVSRNSSTTLRLRRLAGPLTNPTLSNMGLVSVPSHGFPDDVPALGSTVDLDSVDHRLMNAVYRGGSIWTAHCIKFSGRAAARWYEIDVASQNLIQSGTVSDPSLHYFFPTIAVNSRGDAVLAFSGADASQYAACYYTGRTAGNPPGEMAPPALLQAGKASYNTIDDLGRNRWGDYSLCSLDPVDELTIWTIQEYAEATDIWGTRVGQFLFDFDCNDNGIDDFDDLDAGTSADCDGDGIPDECQVGSDLEQDFGGSGGSSFETNGSALVTSGSARLTPAQSSQQGTLIFTRRPLEPIAAFTASFDFRMGGGSGGEGLSFAMLDSGSYDTSDLFGEDGPGAASLVVSFDTRGTGGESDNHVEVFLNGASLGEYQPSFDLNNNQWHRAAVAFAGEAITVELTPSGGSAETAFDALEVAGFVPYRSLFGFGARTGSLTDEHRVDDVVLAASSVTDCNGNLVPDECDIDAGTSADCNGNDIPDECDVADGTSDDCQPNGVPDECEEDCNGNGIPDDCDIAAGTSEDADTNGIPDECEATVLFVDASAGGVGSGVSWADAYADLQPALATAAGPGAIVEQIWVAGGVYTPDGGSGDRSATFALVNGVAVYGGFAGGETSLAQRDPAGNPTVLSGDLAGDDLAGGSNAENSLHVVTLSNTNSTCVLDGFVITAGNANGSTSPDNSGGGIYNESGEARVIGCRVVGNAAFFGGGMASKNAEPAIVNSVFAGNTAEFGAAIFNDGSDITITNTTVGGNTAELVGGGVYNLSGSDPTLTNTILWGNSVGASQSESVQIKGGSPVVNYCCIQGWTGGLGGVGNIGDDPGDDPQYADLAGTDGVSGTADDDLSLSAGTRCIDAGDNDADIDAQLGGDQPLPDVDVLGNPRFADDPDTVDAGQGTPPIVDMGAYEFPVPGVPGDQDGDGDVDLVDFGLWQDCLTGPDAGPYAEGCGNADFDGDLDVDLDDFSAFELLFTGS